MMNIRYPLLVGFTVMAACGGKSATNGNTSGSGGMPSAGDGDGDGDGDGASTGDGDGDDVGGTGGGASAGGTGSGGTGGGGPTLPNLGDECDEPGLPSCSANNTKLTLICGVDGKWNQGVLCGNGEVCDWRTASVTFGSCTDQEGLCVEEADGTFICDGDDLLQCADDGLTVDREVCPRGCQGAACVPGDGCPSAAALDCAGDCDEGGGECFGALPCATVLLGDSPVDTVVRVGEGVTCGYSGPGCGETYVPITTSNMGATLRVTVGEGWQLVAVDGVGDLWDNLCEEEHVLDCVIVPATSEPTHGVVVIPDPGAPPRNVQVEVVSPGTECP